MLMLMLGVGWGGGWICVAGNRGWVGDSSVFSSHQPRLLLLCRLVRHLHSYHLTDNLQLSQLLQMGLLWAYLG